ncbi:T9SS type A sorting domain-containing protein [Pontibacter toksunensis]|uniref:T9SS type A sorting domain-containing protein n=1 Tax=Pontibacter toksunensis TaxID=1332631 RepID=A0ABW6BT46_9BACT
MRQTFTLLLSLLLFSFTAQAQNAIQLHTFEEENNSSDLVLAEEKIFFNKTTSFEVYNLNGGNTFQIPKPISSYLFINRTVGSLGNEVVFNTENGNIYLTQGTHSQELLPSHRSYSICTGKNYTIAVVGQTDARMKVIAVDRTTKVVTTLFERDVWVYGTKLAYLEAEDGMYFTIQMESKRVEVYKTDGTISGTAYLGDIKPINYVDNTFSHLLGDSDELYVVSVDHEITGNTPTATQFFKISGSRIVPAGVVQNVGLYEDQTYYKNGGFLGFDRKTNQLVQVNDNSFTNFFEVNNFTAFQGEFNNNTIFSANSSALSSGDSLVTLYETDGTPAGTKLIAEHVDAFFNDNAAKEFKGNLYFFKYDAVHGRELWRYDGNKSYLFEDIIPGTEGLTEPQFFIYEEELYFTAHQTEAPGKINLYKLTDRAATVKLSSFADYNSNMVKDPEEPFITNMKYTLNQSDKTIFTSESINNLTLEHGVYTLTAEPEEGWLPTSDAPQTTITLPEDNGRSYSFGFVPRQPATKVNVSLMSDATRCGFPTPYTLHYSNNGSTRASGTIKLKAETRFTYESALPAPSRMSGDTLIWEISNLEIGKKGKVTINFTMPGVEHMGDSLISKLITSFRTTVNQSVHTDTTTLQQILTCSYDPNDIQSNPAGLGEKHLTLKNQELEYLIRFQNMGTDKAFNIVVQNELQPEFDLSSFKVIGSSHDMYTVMKGNQVSFHFENIHLPDDKVDEPGSHGYILYSIKPKTGLPDSTVLNNQALIYFDYNPAIETNVSFNTLVDKLPVKTVLAAKGDVEEGTLTVFPNPADTFVNVAWPAGKAFLTSYSILNSKGQTVLQTELNTAAVHQIRISALPPGLYLLKADRQSKVFTKRIIVQ